MDWGCLVVAAQYRLCKWGLARSVRFPESVPITAPRGNKADNGTAR